MRENFLRRRWQSGGAIVNGWLAIPNSFSVKFVTVSSDARLMAAGAQQGMARMRATLPPPPAASGSY
jgi:4-hydroxy-2-oxoheptanedioate aldolase